MKRNKKNKIVWKFLIVLIATMIFSVATESIIDFTAKRKVIQSGGICQLEAIDDASVKIDYVDIEDIDEDKYTVDEEKDKADEEENTVSEEENIVDENKTEEETKVAVVTITANGRYIDKLRYHYEIDKDKQITIDVKKKNGYGKYKTEEITDSLLTTANTSTVNIRGNVKKIVIYFPQFIQVSELVYDNQILFNKYRCLYIEVFVFLLAVSIVFRKEFNKKPENAFLIFALCLGMLIIMIQPPRFMSWDEHIHYGYATGLLEKSGTKMNEAEKYLYKNQERESKAPFLSKEEKAQQVEYLNKISKEKSNLKGYGGYFSISKVGTLHMVIGVWLSKLCGVAFYNQVLIGKILNLLVYSILIFWSIRITPIYKRLVMVMGLMPTPMVLATAYTYDPVITGMFFLGSAFYIKEYYEWNKKLSWKELICIPLLFAIGSCSKAVYIPIILCGMFLPGRKFANRKQEIVWKTILILACVALMFSFIMPAAGGQMEGDARGGDTSVALQMQLIFQHPFVYAKVLMKNICETFNAYVLGVSSFASLAYLGIHKLANFIVLLLFGTALTEPREKMTLQTKKSLNTLKIVSGIMILGTVALIWTALYLSFTEVGSMTIKGVQGRYYIPLSLLGFTVLYTDKIQVKWNKIVYNTVLLLCILLIWNSCLYAKYLVPYCL